MTELSSFNYDLTRVVHGPGGINEMAHVKFGEVCAHGQLRRSCEVCERDERISHLENQLSGVGTRYGLLTRDLNHLRERVSYVLSASIENLRQCDHDCNDRNRAWARMAELLGEIDAEIAREGELAREGDGGHTFGEVLGGRA